jgi:RNA polymerase sigma factor (sigma-70 family)
MSPEHARLWALVLSQQDVIAVALRRLKVHEAEQEDVTQLVLLRAWSLITSGMLVMGADIRKPKRAARMWLVSVANLAVSTWRKTRPERRRALEVFADTDKLETPDPVVRLEARADITHLIGRCSKHERAILAALIEGSTHAEIGKALGAPEGTISTRIRYIRRHLRKHRGK